MKRKWQTVRLTDRQKILALSKQYQDPGVDSVRTVDSRAAGSCEPFNGVDAEEHNGAGSTTRRPGAHSWMVELTNKWLMELGVTTV